MSPLNQSADSTDSPLHNILNFPKIVTKEASQHCFVKISGPKNKIIDIIISSEKKFVSVGGSFWNVFEKIEITRKSLR